LLLDHFNCTLTAGKTGQWLVPSRSPAGGFFCVLVSDSQKAQQGFNHALASIREPFNNYFCKQ
jgi:hypothetical protein